MTNTEHLDRRALRTDTQYDKTLGVVIVTREYADHDEVVLSSLESLDLRRKILLAVCG